jgi:hypothetical protein
MISDHELVLAAAATYDKDRAPLFESIGTSIRVFMIDVNGLPVVAIEGTHDPLGWAIDFCALAAKDHEGVDHASLGWLHAGIYASARAILPRIALSVDGRPYAISGHSLGAGLALMIGGMMIDDGHPPVKIGAFAPPRVGGEALVKVATSVPFCAYHYGDDPVPTVPLTLLPLFPYRQVPLTRIGKPAFDPFSCHHCPNYVADVPLADFPSLPMSA